MKYENIFDQSYNRVMKEGVNFFNVFYDGFLKSSPEVEKAFKNTSMDHQILIMEKSFYKLFVFYATSSVDDYLSSIADNHNQKNLNIKPYLYDLWLECIIETVRKTDQKCNDSVELAWRLILSPGITYMKFMYDHIPNTASMNNNSKRLPDEFNN